MWDGEYAFMILPEYSIIFPTIIVLMGKWSQLINFSGMVILSFLELQLRNNKRHVLNSIIIVEKKMCNSYIGFIVVVEYVNIVNGIHY